MNLAKKLTAVLLIIAMIFCFAACGASDEAESELDIGTINMGFIVTGTVDEDDFSTLHHNLFKTAYELSGAGDGQVTVENNVAANDTDAMNKALDDLSARGVRLIIGTDYSYCKELTTYAKENSDIFFAVLGDYENGSSVKDNVAVLNVKTYQTEYLQGIAAGLSTDAGKVAYVCDTTFGTTQNADINAFALGVKSVNADAEVFLINTDDVKVGVDKAIETECDVIYSRNYIANEETGETFFTVPESLATVMTLNKITKDGNEFISGTSLNLDFLYTKVVLNTVNETFGDLANFNWDIKDGTLSVSPAKDAKVKTAVDNAIAEFEAGKNPMGVEVNELSKLDASITVL